MHPPGQVRTESYPDPRKLCRYAQYLLAPFRTESCDHTSRQNQELSIGCCSCRRCQRKPRVHVEQGPRNFYLTEPGDIEACRFHPRCRTGLRHMRDSYVHDILRFFARHSDSSATGLYPRLQAMAPPTRALQLPLAMEQMRYRGAKRNVRLKGLC